MRMNCVALALWLATVAVTSDAQPISDVPRNGPIPEVRDSIGYPSAEAALAALRVRPGVSFREEGGWTIAEEREARTLWSFTPAGHPAHPSAVKRQIATEQGHVTLKTSVSCQATKKRCDDLVREFDALNEQMIKAIRGGR
jgi:hypothetical protein